MGGGATAWEVGSLRSVVAGVGALAAGVFAAGAFAAPPPLVVRATFDTSTVQFAAAIRIRVVVLLDATQVLPDSLRIVDDLAPLTSLSPGRTSSTHCWRSPRHAHRSAGSWLPRAFRRSR